MYLIKSEISNEALDLHEYCIVPTKKLAKKIIKKLNYSERNKPLAYRTTYIYKHIPSFVNADEAFKYTKEATKNRD